MRPDDSTEQILEEQLRPLAMGEAETGESPEELLGRDELDRNGFVETLPVDGDIRQVSMVMADLRGFTTLCERLALGQTSRILNEYLASMVDVILGQQGLVQDFVGDGILGVFGAPRPDPEHAWHATLSALRMQVAIRRLGGRWRRQDDLSLSLGVAVHSGEVFAGTVGSPRQMKYAVVGDPVNTVARLEELNRTLGTEIVMSGDTLALVHDRVGARSRGLFALRGRSHTVVVFVVLGLLHAPRCAARDANGSLTAHPAVVCPMESLLLPANGRHATRLSQHR